MAELSTLARPYARAAFEYALQTEQLQQWSENLMTAAAITRQSAVSAMLTNPGLTATQKAQALIDLVGDSLPEAMGNFLRILAENRRLQLMPQISQLFEIFKANREKAIDVSVESASELDDAQKAKLTEALGKKLQRTVNMQVSVNKSLLGGLVVRAGDTVIDGSIRGRLAKLAESLNS